MKELLPWAFGFWSRPTSLLDFHCQSGLTDRFAVSDAVFSKVFPFFVIFVVHSGIPRYQDGVAHSLPRTLQTLLGPVSLARYRPETV